MGMLMWIFVGLVLGSIARSVMPGPRAGGIVMAILVGVGGALIGGLTGAYATDEAASAFHLDSLLMALAGSLIVLLSYRAYAMRSMEA